MPQSRHRRLAWLQDTVLDAELQVSRSQTETFLYVKKIWAHTHAVPDHPDVNEEAVRQVNEITDSEPVNGEDLIESEDLKRQLHEAKERLAAESASRRDR